MTVPHPERKHSKFSASGSERWLNCPGSVTLSEGIPSKDSVWSREGTVAHEVLEQRLRERIQNGRIHLAAVEKEATREMVGHVEHAASFILGLKQKLPYADILVETRIALPFIHPEMFGTFDAAIVDHFGVLHVIDFKYGAGHAVNPVKCLQMIVYGMGLAARYDWNFRQARLWIIQPRIKGYDGPTFWDISIPDLKRYVDVFREGVRRAETQPTVFKEGSHCHWCPARPICPSKTKAKLGRAMDLFSSNPL